MQLAWIPNSITMGNLLFGFISIIFAAKGQYGAAGISILAASLCDGFDGQVARMLKVSSKMGAELDSLADCVAFGVAPGFLAYSAYLHGFTIPVGAKPIDVSMFIAAIFPICAAYRLARFNVDSSPTSFSGLPSPIAGIMIALIPITVVPSTVHRGIFIFIPVFIIVALLMVSTVRFSKPQAMLIKKLHGVKLVLLVIGILGFCIFFRRWIFFIIIGLIVLYIISALTMVVIQFIQDHKY